MQQPSIYTVNELCKQHNPRISDFKWFTSFSKRQMTRRYTKGIHYTAGSRKLDTNAVSNF